MWGFPFPLLLFFLSFYCIFKTKFLKQEIPSASPVSRNKLSLRRLATGNTTLAPSVSLAAAGVLQRATLRDEQYGFQDNSNTGRSSHSKRPGCRVSTDASREEDAYCFLVVMLELLQSHCTKVIALSSVYIVPFQPFKFALISCSKQCPLKSFLKLIFFCAARPSPQPHARYLTSFNSDGVS